MPKVKLQAKEHDSVRAPPTWLTRRRAVYCKASAAAKVALRSRFGTHVASRCGLTCSFGPSERGVSGVLDLDRLKAAGFVEIGAD